MTVTETHDTQLPTTIPSVTVIFGRAPSDRSGSIMANEYLYIGIFWTSSDETGEEFGGPGRTRTFDQWIMSPRQS